MATGNTLRFNAAMIKAAKPQNGKRTDYKIDDVPGLWLRVQPTGSATYSYRYSVGSGRTGRKQRRELIGSRDVVSLHEAREKALELAKQVVVEGIDPKAERERLAAEQSQNVTFKELAERRLEMDDRIGEATKKSYGECYALDVFPTFGDVPADNVTPEMVVDLLDKIEQRGSVTKADKTRSAIGSAYKWGVRRRLVANDPTSGLGNRATQVPRDVVFTDDQMRSVFSAMDEGKVSDPMRLIMKLCAYTGQRAQEVAGSLKSELHDLDGENPTWIIAGAKREKGRTVRGRVKNQKEQVVPLSPQAVELFKEALALTNIRDRHIFPADTSRVAAGKTADIPHIRVDSISTAFGRIRREFEFGDATVHDFRSCVATWCGDQGIRPDVIDRILNHQPRDVTRKHYNHSALTPMVSQALNAWADHLDSVVSGKEEASNVVSFSKVGS